METQGGQLTSDDAFIAEPGDTVAQTITMPFSAILAEVRLASFDCDNPSARLYAVGPNGEPGEQIAELVFEKNKASNHRWTLRALNSPGMLNTDERIVIVIQNEGLEKCNVGIALGNKYPNGILRAQLSGSTTWTDYVHADLAFLLVLDR